MAKAKDFYGIEVAAVIEEACREFGVSQEELTIEVLETGSAGIFGLCRKKAHIRVQKKKVQTDSATQAKDTEKNPVQEKAQRSKKSQPAAVPEQKTSKKVEGKKKMAAPVVEAVLPDLQADDKVEPPVQEKQRKAQEPVEPLSEDILLTIREDILRLLELMGYPSTVTLTVEDSTLHCHLSGEHEEILIGSEGRTLDSLQYLLRKMMSQRLPDRMMLTLDAGNFRERRSEELKVRAQELAKEVKETGKTQAIPALNPAERRVVHMVLQEDKAIRSRSVGEGLFKKILIYKPGKGNKASRAKRKNRSGGPSSEN